MSEHLKKELSPPSSAATINSNSTSARTVRKQRSRILGTPSQQELHSRYVKDKEQEDKQVEPLNEERAKDYPTGEEAVVSSREPSPQPLESEQQQPDANVLPRRESTWSIWPRRASLETKARPPSSPTLLPPPSTTESVKSTAASTKSNQSQEETQAEESGQPLNKSQEAPDLDAASIKSKESIDKKDRSGSWISWRKTSLTSSKKQVDEDVLNTTDQLKSVASENAGDTLTAGGAARERTTSWSLWNNTSTTSTRERPSLSNILLSGNGEAILFEPTTKSENESSKRQPKRSPNCVVPDFDRSLPYYSTTTSIINNINRLRYTLGFDVEDPKHLYRTQSKPEGIKKVLIIGVHGFFPTKVLRPLIGEPTGTSIKFANEAEKSIWRWAKRENLNIQVQKLALEKEGKIFERVEFFYEVIQKWKADVESADYIYVAAHSQGCPVSILLLSRLIEDGVLSMEGKRISLLCMAGINNGPFYGADQKLFVRAYSTIESDSLMELFQFQNFDSVHSRAFLQALRTVIGYNVKITFVGSINDQLVPLYSSTCLHVRHPNIFRATYIDGGSHTPAFVSKTVSIANHLHNLGLSDHGVIKEISNSLAGPLTGGGHSKIYNDPQVYDLALSFSLYTSDLKYQIPLHFKPYVIDQLGLNPYHLPWCMRGLLFEARVHLKDADEDIQALFDEFENWKPETKQLKDMKYRLAGIKSKL